MQLSRDRLGLTCEVDEWERFGLRVPRAPAWDANPSIGTTPLMSTGRESPALSANFVTHLLQPPVHAPVHRGLLLAEHLRHLRQGQVGAVAQRDRLAFLGGQALERAPQ